MRKAVLRPHASLLCEALEVGSQGLLPLRLSMLLASRHRRITACSELSKYSKTGSSKAKAEQLDQTLQQDLYPKRLCMTTVYAEVED